MKTTLLAIALSASVAFSAEYSVVPLITNATITNSTAHATKPIIDLRRQNAFAIEAKCRTADGGTNISVLFYFERSLDGVVFDNQAVLTPLSLPTGLDPAVTNVFVTNIIATSVSPIPYGYIRVAVSNSSQYGVLTNFSLRYAVKVP
jgi:hypothetical protein